MTRLLGWIIITLMLASISMGLLYPCYRVALRFYPKSSKIRWIYGATAAAFGIALRLGLPLLVHRLFPRY